MLCVLCARFGLLFAAIAVGGSRTRVHPYFRPVLRYSEAYLPTSSRTASQAGVNRGLESVLPAASAAHSATRIVPAHHLASAASVISRRDVATVLGLVTPTGLVPVAWGEQQPKLDEYGRALLPDGSTGASSGVSYEGAATFLGKPKVFVAGSTGELGRRVVFDLLRSGYSVYCAYRDKGRAAEVQYANRKTKRYEQILVPDGLIEGGREKELAGQLANASVVIHVAGARQGFDIFRPGVGLDTTEPEKTDLNGTKALVDAAVAKGVKKFIYVSAILTNARALGPQVYETDEFKKWNSYGNVLDCKHDAEEYLKRSGLDYTIIRPAPMTNDLPKDVGGIWFGQPDTILLQSGEVGNKISRDDVSLACLDAVFNEKASRGTFELVGVQGMQPTSRDRWWIANPSGKIAKPS